MIDREYYIKKGMEAAKAYLLHKQPLNDTIAKIAMADNLSPDQVDRIVEYANHSVVASLYKKSVDSRYIQFDVADKRCIRQKIADGSMSFPMKAARAQNHSPIDEYITVDDMLQLKLAVKQTLKELFSEKRKYAEEIDSDEIKLKGKMEDVYDAARSSILNGEPWEDIKKVLIKNIGEQNTAFIEKNLINEGMVIDKEDRYANSYVNTTAIDENSNDLVRVAEYKLASKSLYGRLVKLAYVNSEIAKTSDIMTGIGTLYDSISDLGDELAVRGFGITIKVAESGPFRIRVPKILKKEPEVMEGIEKIKKSVKIPGVKKLTKLLGGNSLYMAVETIPTITKRYVAFF